MAIPMPPPIPGRSTASAAPPPPPPRVARPQVVPPQPQPQPVFQAEPEPVAEYVETTWEDDGDWQQDDPGHALAPATSHALATPVAIDFDTMDVAQIAKAQGMEGLDFNQYGVLPLCSLNKGMFRLSDGTSLGVEFVCVIQGSRAKYLYKTATKENSPDFEVAYSYAENLQDDPNTAEKIQGWAQKGIGYEVKKYLEATCVLPDRQVILLSIPPTSISRLSTHVVNLTMARKKISQVKTRVYIAPEVTKAKMPFTPIGFAIAE